MSQTFFSKLDVPEKNSRLGQLAESKANVTIWIKGRKEKHVLQAMTFDKGRQEVVLDSQEDIFSNGTGVLCSFVLRGMTFFSQVVFRKTVGLFVLLHFTDDLFKSERRSSYRLLTFPLYEVWAYFDLGEIYEGGKVIDMNSRVSQTKLFQNFIKLIDSKEGRTQELSKIKIRVQDISTTGMAIHVGELEAKHFSKEKTFEKVVINFSDEDIEIPEVKVVYVVDYISNDKNMKRYKVGCHFPDLSTRVDDLLGKKINKLLRQNDFNKDFENFIK